MKKKLLALAKELDFNNAVEYFDYLIECYINGNFDSCKRLFAEMEREDQKVFLIYMNGQASFNGLLQARNFYFNLL